jgi:hypothetical protein
MEGQDALNLPPGIDANTLEQLHSALGMGAHRLRQSTQIPSRHLMWFTEN